VEGCAAYSPLQQETHREKTLIKHWAHLNKKEAKLDVSSPITGIYLRPFFLNSSSLHNQLCNDLLYVELNYTIMPIKMTLDAINAMTKGTLMEQLGIVYTDFGADYISATMPVDHRTIQPAGLLHGGASVALAESLGSMGSVALLNNPKAIVGIEVNANHVRKATSGNVHGRAALVVRSRRLHVWEIKIHNDDNELVCLSRLTIMVIATEEKPS
jgi:1,4-dihydroxy-2-naphthoyl-CoA hydrolase